MRSAVACALVLAIAACNSNGEDTDSAEQDVTGGSSGVEASAVYLFDGVAVDLAPKCAGALLGEKIAVTTAACAKADMIVGLASDKHGRGAGAKVTKVHALGADAEISLVELDRLIGGIPAVITNAPLNDDYVVNGIASVDSFLFGPDKGEAASVNGRMTSETDTHSTLYPARGKEICAGDLGAPVCSSTSRGVCGLAGLVTGPEAATPTNTEASPTGPSTATCSGGPWKVVTLGRYAELIKELAPAAFQPRVVSTFFGNRTVTPEGLWGHQRAGRVATCSIETKTLDPVDPRTPAKLTAKVSFRELGDNPSLFARFGIASASAPTNMRWLPAKLIASTGRAPAIDSAFEGAVSALADGDYVVAFRASTDGGETWTPCDVDGIENGFSNDKTVRLTVSTTRQPGGGGGGGADAGAEPKPEEPKPEEPKPEEPKPGESTDPDKKRETPPPADPGDDLGSDYSDPSPKGTETDLSSDSDDDDEPSSESDEDDLPVAKKKKKKASSGCSASPTRTNAASSLPLVGLALAALSVVRRRRVS